MVVENKQTSVLLACDSAEEETKMFRNPSLPAVLAPANQIWVAFGIRMTSFTLHLHIMNILKVRPLAASNVCKSK